MTSPLRALARCAAGISLLLGAARAEEQELGPEAEPSPEACVEVEVEGVRPGTLDCVNQQLASKVERVHQVQSTAAPRVPPLSADSDPAKLGGYNAAALAMPRGKANPISYPSPRQRGR